MPRLIACNVCHVLQKAPDPHPKTPMVPARIVWEDGTDYVYKDEDGLPKMVPAYDPVLEDFVERHDHNRPDIEVLEGQVIRVWQVDQRTWDSVDIVQKIRKEMHEMTGEWYDDRDTYREGATECYNKHGNPTLQTGCSDFLSDGKRIGKASHHIDGKTIDIPPQYRQYLCYQCPYFQSYIQVEIRRKAGAYT